MCMYVCVYVCVCVDVCVGTSLHVRASTSRESVRSGIVGRAVFEVHGRSWIRGSAKGEILGEKLDCCGLRCAEGEEE